MATFLFICVLLSTMTMFISAESTFPNVLGGKLENGLVGIRYYYGPSLNANMRTAVETAVDDWTWAINDLAVMQDSNLQCHFVKSNSPYNTLHIQFVEANLEQGAVANTTWYGNGPRINPEKSSWTSCLVEIDTDEFLALTTEQQRSVMNHEIGHVLGLRHNTEDNGVLMWWNLIEIDNGYVHYLGSTASVPTAEDLHNIRYLYE